MVHIGGDRPHKIGKPDLLKSGRLNHLKRHDFQFIKHYLMNFRGESEEMVKVISELSICRSPAGTTLLQIYCNK